MLSVGREGKATGLGPGPHTFVKAARGMPLIARAVPLEGPLLRLCARDGITRPPAVVSRWGWGRPSPSFRSLHAQRGLVALSGPSPALGLLKCLCRPPTRFQGIMAPRPCLACPHGGISLAAARLDGVAHMPAHLTRPAF